MLSTFVKRNLNIKITGRGIDKVIQAKKGDNIVHLCEELKIPIPMACEGNGACATCHVYVNKGMEFLAPISDREYDTLDFAPELRENSRLACQCKPITDDGDVELIIPAQSRNVI